MTTSRVYELTRPQHGHLIHRDPPDPDVGQVLVRVHAVGLCASDLPTWTGLQPKYPQPLGHEPVGQVVATGPGVSLPPGTWVGGRIFPSFADYAIADMEDVVEIPHGVDVSKALVEPLGCVAEALRRTAIQMGATVAVVGLGFMGLVMVQLLRTSGAARIVAIDPRVDARRVALATGADDCYSPDQVNYEGHHQPDRGRFDTVVEASGTAAGLEAATALVRPHGTICVLGFHQSHRTVDMRAWNWKAIDVVNGHVRDRRLLQSASAAALELQAHGRIDLDPLITHRFRLQQVDEAFRTLHDKPGGFIKAVVTTD